MYTYHYIYICYIHIHIHISCVYTHAHTYIHTYIHTWTSQAPGAPASSQLSRPHTSAYVSIRQHPSESVSIRQHTSAYVRTQHAPKRTPLVASNPTPTPPTATAPSLSPPPPLQSFCSSSSSTTTRNRGSRVSRRCSSRNARCAFSLALSARTHASNMSSLVSPPPSTCPPRLAAFAPPVPPLLRAPKKTKKIRCCRTLNVRCFSTPIYIYDAHLLPPSIWLQQRRRMRSSIRPYGLIY
jgi:hypothetical protein